MVPSIPQKYSFWPFLRPMRGTKRPQTNISKSACVVLNVTYLYHAIWGLNHLDFSGYNNIYSDFTHFVAFWVYLGAPMGP